jgi:hypothetical protein
VGVAEGVEGMRAGRAVGVGCAVDVDIHALREDLERLRGRRPLLCVETARHEKSEQ